MTAQIETQFTRKPIANPLGHCETFMMNNADLTTRRDQGNGGQLWERVAETRSNAPAPLTARQDAGIVRAYAEKAPSRGPRVGGGYKSLRSQQSSNTYRMAASGIIRAGERVK